MNFVPIWGRLRAVQQGEFLLKTYAAERALNPKSLETKFWRDCFIAFQRITECTCGSEDAAKILQHLQAQCGVELPDGVVADVWKFWRQRLPF